MVLFFISTPDNPENYKINVMIVPNHYDIMIRYTVKLSFIIKFSDEIFVENQTEIEVNLFNSIRRNSL